MDDFIFDKWNEVAAYLLGVLYTDGHIAKQSLNRHSVDICLAKKDEEWLMQLRAAFKCNSRIVEYNQILPSTGNRFFNVSFQFHSTRIHKKLIEMGIKEQLFPELPSQVFHHFLRGCSDGDGSFYFSKQANAVRWSLVGAHDFLMRVREELNKAIGTSCKMQLDKKTENGSCWGLTYGNKDSQKIAKFLYRDATIFLKRKKDKSQQPRN